jgi:hypothetical protein
VVVVACPASLSAAGRWSHAVVALRISR